MKQFTKLVCALGFSALAIGAAKAETVINNWYFNPNGTGFATATQINENLDVVGGAFIDLTATSATAFTFTEKAVFNVPAHDQGAPLPMPNFITATFSGAGAGSFAGGFAFGSGQVTFYSDTANNYSTSAGIFGANDGTSIATFDVLPGGGGFVDATGNPVANGIVTIFLKATSPGGLASGYFFDPLGNDLSSTDVLAFAFTNANPIASPTTLLVNELACQFAGFGGALCPVGVYDPLTNSTPTHVDGDYFFVGNNGQFKLTVPEPGSVALVGLSLLALGAASRRRAPRV